MIKTGLLFGSFNPIHIGHIAIAGYMKEFESMDEIWFIISPRNPFKNPGQLVSPVARLEMARMAVDEFPSFTASDIEFNMPRPSYTINTLEKLAEEYPGNDFHIILGTDNVKSIGKWKGGETLLSDYKFLIYPRPGTDRTGMDQFSHARLAEAPLIEISSSFIRRSIMEGKNMRAFVPPGIWEYIERNGFYTGK